MMAFLLRESKSDTFDGTGEGWGAKPALWWRLAPQAGPAGGSYSAFTTPWIPTGDKLPQRKWSQVRRVCRLSVDSLSYAFTALSRRNAVNNASFSQFLSNFFPSNKSVMAKGWLTVDTDLGLTILINSYLIQNTRLVSARQRQEIYALNKVMTRLENEKFSLIKWGIHLTILPFQTSGHFECITGARWLDVKEKTRIMVRRTYLCDRVTLCACFRNFFWLTPLTFRSGRRFLSQGWIAISGRVTKHMSEKIWKSWYVVLCLENSLNRSSAHLGLWQNAINPCHQPVLWVPISDWIRYQSCQCILAKKWINKFEAFLKTKLGSQQGYLWLPTMLNFRHCFKIMTQLGKYA